MVEAEPRFDAGGEQAVDQSVVKSQPSFVHRATTGRQNARPGNREPVGADAEIAHQRDVLGVAVIVIAGDIASIAVGNTAGYATVSVPDARPAPIDLRCAFDLVARGRDAPNEIARQ